MYCTLQISLFCCSPTYTFVVDLSLGRTLSPSLSLELATHKLYLVPCFCYLYPKLISIIAQSKTRNKPYCLFLSVFLVQSIVRSDLVIINQKTVYRQSRSIIFPSISFPLFISLLFMFCVENGLQGPPPAPRVVGAAHFLNPFTSSFLAVAFPFSFFIIRRFVFLG
jgi:hypothetical protein